MAGTIKITFTELPVHGDTTTVDLRYLDNTGQYKNLSLRMNFVPTRLRSEQVTIGSSTLDVTQNYAMAFNLDYRNVGGTGNFSARVVQDIVAVGEEGGVSVELKVNNPSWEFVGVSGHTYFLEYIIENTVIKTPKSVRFVGYDYTHSTCSTPVAVFNLTGGSGIYKAYINGGPATTEEASPVKTPLNRDNAALYNFLFTDSAGVTIGTLNFKTPPRISEDKINVGIAYTDMGAAVSVNVDFISTHIMPLTYSLDGITFIEENIFTGQPEGDYTVYVKDAFGCVVSKDFTVDGFSTVTETIFSLSDINPIRYAISEEGKKNRYNTLSFEQNKNIANAYIQYFTEGDNPITQLKTNAKYLNIFALDCEGVKHPLAPVQRSNHLDQAYKTTATKFSTSDGLLGLYFGVVDVLDVTTGDVLESKDFGYQIPNAFNRAKSFINIEGVGTVAVESANYDEDYEAFVLTFNIAYTGAPQVVTVDSRYNIQDYEIYEFLTPMASLPESFYVIIEAGSSSTDIKYTFISENINKIEDSKDIAEIIYWNTKNLGGMNYATGVVHTLRLPSFLSRLAGSSSVEGYDGDTERYNTNIGVFDGEEFIFLYLSEEMARKLKLILVHDRLFINGVLYRLGDEAPEVNSRFTTNMCELTALLRTGGDLTESFSKEVVEYVSGEGADRSTYELEQAIAAAKGKALILWKQ